MSLVYWLHLGFQSAVQACFLCLYWKGKISWLKLAILTLLITFVLYPADSLLFPNQIVFRIAFDIIFMYLAGRILFRHETRWQIAKGALLCLVGMLICELLGLLLCYLILHRAPLVFPLDHPLVYTIADLTEVIGQMTVLWISARTLSQSVRLNLLLTLICLNMLIVMMICCIAIAPTYHVPFRTDYLSLSSVLFVLNAVLLVLLAWTAKKDSKEQALKQIHSVYERQVSSYLESEQEEEKLRKLRHDLKNFILSNSSGSGEH